MVTGGDLTQMVNIHYNIQMKYDRMVHLKPI